MDEPVDNRPKKRKNLSQWILAYDKNAYCDSKIEEDDRELLIDSFNECSDLRKSFHDSLKNLFSNFGFSRMQDSIQFENSFNSTKYPKFGLRKSYYYDGDLKLFKNNSVSKFHIKKKAKQQNNKNKKKTINTLRKKMFPQGEEFEDFQKDSKKVKTEKDLYELEIINKMIFENKGKETNYNVDKRKDVLTEQVIESENEDTEENRTYRNYKKSERDNVQKDKILNRIFGEIEKGKSSKKENEEEFNEYKGISKNRRIKEKYPEKDNEKEETLKSSITKANSSIRKSEKRFYHFNNQNEEDKESDKNSNEGRISAKRYRKFGKYDENNKNRVNNAEHYKFNIEGEILSPIRREKETKGRYDASEDNDTEKEIKVNTLYKNEKSKRSYYTKKKNEDHVENDKEEKILFYNKGKDKKYRRFGKNSEEEELESKESKEVEETEESKESGCKEREIDFKLEITGKYKCQKDKGSKTKIKDGKKSKKEEPININLNLEINGEKDSCNGEIKGKRQRIKDSEESKEDKNSHVKNYGIRGFLFSEQKNKDEHEMTAFIKIKKKRTKSELNDKGEEEKDINKYNRFNRRVIEKEKDDNLNNMSEKRIGFTNRFNISNNYDDEDKVIYKKVIKKEIVEENEKPKRYYGRSDKSETESNAEEKLIKKKESSDKQSLYSKTEKNEENEIEDIKISVNRRRFRGRVFENKEEKENKENDRLERIKREKEEKERKERERLEIERIENERLEKERVLKTKKEKEKLERERIEKERHIELERKERERREREERERKERIERERREREEKERKEKLERERREKERLENERREKERREREERERKERLERESREKERLENEKREREERERREREEIEEKERREREERERRERLEKERREKQRLEMERIERERKEREERERREKEDREKKVISKKVGDKLIDKYLETDSKINNSKRFKKNVSISSKGNTEEDGYDNSSSKYSNNGFKTAYKSKRFSLNKDKLKGSSSPNLLNTQFEDNSKKLTKANLQSPKASRILGEINKNINDEIDGEENDLTKETNYRDKNNEYKLPETPKGRFRFKFSRVEESGLEKNNKLNKYEEVIEIKADEFKGKMFKKEQIDKLKSNKNLLDKAEKESNQSDKTEESKIYKKKKVMKKEKEDETELNGKGFGKNKFSKKGLRLQTEEEEIDENLKESLKYSEMNKKGKMRYENEFEDRTKKYKKQKVNISIDEDEYGDRLFSESNINSGIFPRKGLPTKIKIYKCVVWKNTDPDLTEEAIKSLFHKRNKSQGLNSSFIMKLPDGMNLEETLFSDNEEKKKVDKFGKNKIKKFKK